MSKSLPDPQLRRGKKDTAFSFRRILLGGIISGAISLVLPGHVLAQDYPTQPIRLVVPYPAGGSGDFVGRLYAEHLSELVGRRVIVENVPGAGTNIATDMVARAEPDGYTLLLGTSQSIINTVFGPSPAADPLSAFAPVGLIAHIPFMVAAHPSAHIASVNDLIREAKANPEKLSLGHAQFQAHASLLRETTGSKFIVVPYKGGAQAITDAIGGQVGMVLSLVPVLMSNLQSKNLVAVGVASDQRVTAIPDVPTFAEQGYPRFTSSFWFSLLAPKGTPPGIVARLTQHTLAIVQMPSFVIRLRGSGGEPLLGDVNATIEKMRSEHQTWNSLPIDRVRESK